MNKKNSAPKNWQILLKVFMAIVSLGLLAEYLISQSTKPDLSKEVSKASFAQCLTDKGLVMYGVDTCEYCQAQKKMFGASFEKINYVKCDFDKQICQNKGISGYPVWEINGKLSQGVKTFDQLTKATGCLSPK